MLVILVVERGEGYPEVTMQAQGEQQVHTDRPEVWNPCHSRKINTEWWFVLTISINLFLRILRLPVVIVNSIAVILFGSKLNMVKCNSPTITHNNRFTWSYYVLDMIDTVTSWSLKLTGKGDTKILQVLEGEQIKAACCFFSFHKLYTNLK